jgi:predicted nucleic acid-binding protein
MKGNLNQLNVDGQAAGGPCMIKCPVKIYADTSVYGGVFDEEFAGASQAFFDLVRSGKYILCVSEVVHQELSVAPKKVHELFRDFLPIAQLLDIGHDALELQQAYIVEGILTEKWYDDALHVALATVAECNVIVSWNFKHIVNFRKIPQFNAVNVLKGYRQIAIHSPLEVIDDEE